MTDTENQIGIVLSLECSFIVECNPIAVLYRNVGKFKPAGNAVQFPALNHLESPAAGAAIVEDKRSHQQAVVEIRNPDIGKVTKRWICETVTVEHWDFARNIDASGSDYQEITPLPDFRIRAQDRCCLHLVHDLGFSVRVATCNGCVGTTWDHGSGTFGCFSNIGL